MSETRPCVEGHGAAAGSSSKIVRRACLHKQEGLARIRSWRSWVRSTSTCMPAPRVTTTMCLFTPPNPEQHRLDTALQLGLVAAFNQLTRLGVVQDRISPTSPGDAAYSSRYQAFVTEKLKNV